MMFNANVAFSQHMLCNLYCFVFCYVRMLAVHTKFSNDLYTAACSANSNYFGYDLDFKILLRCYMGFPN